MKQNNAAGPSIALQALLLFWALGVLFASLFSFYLPKFMEALSA